MLYIILLS